jgi:hypothetical protein
VFEMVRFCPTESSTVALVNGQGAFQDGEQQAEEK